MRALDYFLARGIRLELDASDNVRAIGTLNDSLRMEIRAQKSLILGELQWCGFETILALAIAEFKIPADEVIVMRELAASDLTNALNAYRASVVVIAGSLPVLPRTTNT